MLIDLTGAVRPCLPLWDEPVGNRFFDCWNGPAFRALRSALGSESMSTLCKTCTARIS